MVALVKLAENVAVVLLVSAPIAAAWALGGARESDHVWIFTPVILAGFLSLVVPQRVVWRPHRELVWRSLLVGSLVLLGVLLFVQSGGVFGGGVDSLSSPALGSAVSSADSGPKRPDYLPLTVDPFATRSRFVQYLGVLFALLASWRLFGRRERRPLVLAILLFNGAIISLFGILQRQALVTGHEIVSLSPHSNASQFGPFVNRNNASLFLHLSCAAGLGLGCRPRTRDEQRPIDWLTWVALMIVLAGIACSGSVSGIAAALVGFVVLACVWSDHRRQMLRNLFVVAALLAVGLTSLRIVPQTLTRALTGSSVVSSLQVRWNHWADTGPVVRDFPLFGTGAGTYSLVNPPFQQHAAFGHFARADNLVFEELVELGFVGLGVCALAAAGFLGIVLRLVRTHGTPEAWGMGLVGLWVLTSVLTNCASDFGLLLPANALLTALLAGCVLAFAPVDERAPHAARQRSSWMQNGLRVAGWSAIVALLPWGPIAAREMANYRESDTALTAFRQLHSPPDSGDLSTLRQSIDRALAQCPDDARLSKAMADVHVLTFRRALAERLADSAAFAAVDPRDLWRLTSLGRLAPLLRTNESAAAVNEIRSAVSEPNMQQLLAEADRYLNQAIRQSPFLPNADLELAQIAVLRHESMTAVEAALRRAVTLQPAEFPVLQQASVLAAALQDHELLSVCVRQLLTVYGADEAKRTFARLVAAAAFPNDCPWQMAAFRGYPEELMLLADIMPSECGREFANAAHTDLKQRLASDPTDADAHALMARVQRSRDVPQEQIEHLRIALELRPRQIDWRLELAEVLIEQGNNDDARNELRIAEALCENQERVLNQIRTLQTQCRQADIR